MHDVASVQLQLRAEKTNTIPFWLGRAIQAEFLSGLHNINPALSAEIHDQSGQKPFTTSNLLNDNTRRTELRQIKRGETYRVQYNTLHPHLTTIVLNGLIPRWHNARYTLHDQRFTVTAIDTQPRSDRSCVNYRDLIDNASREQRIGFAFDSPTSFRRDGTHYPLPDPMQVFLSLYNRWNAFSDLPMPSEIAEIIKTQIVISRMDNIRTHIVRFARGNKGSVTGFTGHVVYHLRTRDTDTLQHLNALAAFAPYSGVGVKTHYGLGHVRLIID